MDLGGGAYSRAKWLPETPPAPPATPVAGGGNALELAIAARTTTETVFRIDDNLSYLLTHGHHAGARGATDDPCPG